MATDALNRIIETAGPFTDESYIPGPHVKEFLENSKILVIGAGGLGCEILKNLALSGFKDIHVIDMDTIDISNLNRQFLFRAADIGKPKAMVAADFISKRVGVKITPYFGKIQDKDEAYYRQFTLVVCGLDSVEARRWINALLVNMVDDENPESIKPLIDGGSEGFKGQARVIIPTISSCYECSLDMLGRQQTYPICTIANTPRLPEHCIEWASELEWARVFPGKKLDNDNMDHIQWLYEVALQRANEFNITGVTYSLTQGVVKNIIPSIASTNAIIAAACCNEALKIITSVNPYLDNYMMYTGNEGVYTYTFQHQRKEKDCPVCGKGDGYLIVKLSKDRSLEDFITEDLMQRPEIKVKSPSLRTARMALYYQSPPQLKESTEPNLSKKMVELVNEDEEIVVTDPTLPFSLRLRLSYE